LQKKKYSQLLHAAETSISSGRVGLLAHVQLYLYLAAKQRVPKSTSGGVPNGTRAICYASYHKKCMPNDTHALSLDMTRAHEPLHN